MQPYEVATVFASIVPSVFFAGVAWGRLKSIDTRLKSIESLFRLQLREGVTDD